MAAADASADATALPLPASGLFTEAAIEPLEATLRAGGPGATAAGKALLRLYSMYPARTSRDVVAAALAQALTALPRNDFQLALYMVPAALRGDEVIAALEACERELQAGRFPAFWSAIEAEVLARALAAAGGFREGVRGFMLGAINRCYTRIAVEELGRQLALPAAEAAAFAERAGWAIDGAEAVAPVLPDNSPRPKQAAGKDEGLKPAEVAGLIATLSRGS